MIQQRYKAKYHRIVYSKQTRDKEYDRCTQCTSFTDHWQEIASLLSNVYGWVIPKVKVTWYLFPRIELIATGEWRSGNKIVSYSLNHLTVNYIILLSMSMGRGKGEWLIVFLMVVRSFIEVIYYMTSLRARLLDSMVEASDDLMTS